MAMFLLDLETFHHSFPVTMSTRMKIAEEADFRSTAQNSAKLSAAS